METKQPANAPYIIDTLEAARWKGAWGCDALDIPGTSTYVNSVDTTVDGDYMMWYLVEVCDRDLEATEHYLHGPDLVPSTTGETWVSYLAVYEGPGGEREHQWHGSRNRFFDRDTTPIYDIRKWFLTFVEDTPGRDRKYGWG